MPSRKFTTKTAASLKPIPGRRMEYFDTATPGLALRVTGAGVKTWALLYRHRGRLRRLTLGTLKNLGLAEARAKARNAVRSVGDGKDPAAEKQQARTAQTIADLIDDYIEQYARLRKRSWREDRRILQNVVKPVWKHKAIAEVARRDVRALIEGMAEEAPVSANRTLACIRKMFSFALDRELIEVNPASRMARPGAEQSRDRVLTDEEIRTFWQASEELEPAMRAFYRLRLLTAQRGGEVAAMQWQDVDLTTGWWTIPAAVAKNKMAHRVPLGLSALAIVKDLTPAADGYVLAGARGRRQQSEAAQAFADITDFRGHDMRRTAATLMASRGGIPRLTIGKLLNHAEKGITAIYDRASYDAEKQAAIAWWDAHLKEILDAGTKTRGTVRPFTGRAR